MTTSRYKRAFPAIGTASMALLLTASVWFGYFDSAVSGQAAEYERFRKGEKLTYHISFEKFENAAYAEVLVASKGTIEGKPAVELQGKVKSLKFVSAAFYLFDRTRTVFASADSGLPMYIRDVSNTSGLPIEKISNYLSLPSTDLDLLTLLYRVRENGGAGSFTVLENKRVYAFNFASTGGETVKTRFADFETNVSEVTSNYFDQYGISNVRVNFSTDGRRIPVQIRFKVPKGRFQAVLASASIITPPPTPVPDAPTPTPTPTPAPTPGPTPIAVNALSPDLPFKLGERLEYAVSNSGQKLGKVVFTAQAIEKINGVESLKIEARVAESRNHIIFSTGDYAMAAVDPVTLVPFLVEQKLTGSLSEWSETAVFDQSTGTVTFSGTTTAEIPIGTHSLLSFVYAIRSFNLRKSDDPKSPVNDTRVAVFANNKAFILTLRPSIAEKIEVLGRETRGQLVTIITGDPAIDALSPRVWLSTDKQRLPLIFTFGDFKAELIR